MAIIFCLWVECADDGKSAGAVARHFSGLTHTLLSGLNLSWRTDASSRFVTVWSEAFPWNGIGSLQNAADMSEAGIHLLQKLRSAPDFLMSRVGMEVDNSSLAEFLEDAKEDPVGISEGTVLSRDAWKSLGRPRHLRLFRPGYAWNPWLGQWLNPTSLPQYRPIAELGEKLPGWTNSTEWTEKD